MREIEWLNRYGHFDNPIKSEAMNVSPMDVARDVLTLDDKPVVEAVQSIQELDLNYFVLGHQILGREPDPDGRIGPVTRALMSLPRCACPDYATATGHGGWPVGCHVEYRDIHAVKVHLDTRRCPSSVRTYLQWSVEQCIRMSQEIGLHSEWTVEDGPTNPTRFDLSSEWERLVGPVIGWNQLPSATCRQHLSGRLDIDFTPDRVIFAVLMEHEILGHGAGLGHSRGGIMNPSIIRTELSWLRDPSLPALRRMYGGEPVIPDPGPTPVPTPIPVPTPTPIPVPIPVPEPEPEEPEAPNPMGEIFKIILEVAIELIRGGDLCGREQIRNPGLLQRLRLQRGVRDKLKLNRREWREQRHEIQRQIDDAIGRMTEEDAEYLMDLAREEVEEDDPLR